MFRTGLFTFIVTALAVSTSAQTTRPAEKALEPVPSAPASTAQPPAAQVRVSQAWPKAVERLAKAISKADPRETSALLSSRVIIHRFESLQTVETPVLLHRLGKSTLVGQHAYMQAPLVMAADIAADFKNAAAIDEKSKASFLIDDDSEMRRANSTAAQWVNEQLGTEAGTPIGVIVLWTPRPAATGSGGETAIYDAIFVLCKGEEVSPNEFSITTLIFGSPIMQRNP
jgi:hypothetical protein